MRLQDFPPAAVEALTAVAERGAHPSEWPAPSEQFYWAVIAHRKPFRSCYASEGGPQPAIATRDTNLSQTAREQCEVEGLVAGGLHLEGPGQAVVLHGLQAAPELNGQRARVLPLAGPGAPRAVPGEGRVPVRLQGGREVACKPANLRPAHPAPEGAGTGAGAAMEQAEAGGAGSTAQQQQRLPRPSGQLADLIRADVMRGAMPPALTPDALRQAGMPASLLKCCDCGDGSADRYLAMVRTLPLSPQPLPKSALRIKCIDCVVRAAERAKVRANETAVGEWVDSIMMGSVEACSLLMGHPSQRWGGVHGSGALY